MGTDEKEFIEILCSCKPETYQQVCEIYETKYNTTIEKTIKREFTGKDEDAFITAHLTLLNQAQSIACQVDISLKGLSADEVLPRRLTILFSDRVHGEDFKEAY